MSEYLETFARRFVGSRAPWTRGETEDLILKLADKLAEWRNGSEHVNGKLLDAIAAKDKEIERLRDLLKLLLKIPGDHMTVCDKTMGDSHACTCGASLARAALGEKQK